MNNDYLKKFSQSERTELFKSNKYGKFEKYINKCLSGTGFIGESYLMLWEKEDIEELNDLYEVNEFLDNSILIGSDGGDIGYGININGQFFEVPFIGMDIEEVHIIAEDFEGFIQYLGNQLLK